jgi:glycerophosphoryl diester phosphodiesterase
MNWNVNRPIIIAHRGVAGEAPENTMASFQLAMEQQCDFIELDIHLNKDEHIVVCHDETIDRTTSGNGKIIDLTLSELKSVDAGSWFNSSYAGQQIPLLSEVLDYIPPEMVLNIEIKQSYDGRLEKLTADLIRQYDRMDSVLFTSFDHKLLYRLKQYAPEARIGLVYGTMLANPLQLIKDFGLEVYSIHPHYEMITAYDIAAIRSHGCQVFVWTVNNQKDMKILLRHNVSGIITDYASRMRSLVLDTIRS